jgi:hypothetical protein
VFMSFTYLVPGGLSKPMQVLCLLGSVYFFH